MKKTIIRRLVLLNTLITLTLILSCKAQSNQSTNSSPKVENYSYGEMDLKVTPFGSDKKISVGKINEDGTIQLSWPEIDPSTIEGSDVYMQDPISALIDMYKCEDMLTKENTEHVKVKISGYIYLYNNERLEGILFPGTDKAILENGQGGGQYTNLVLGSSISWIYSSGDCLLKGNCSDKQEWEGKYDFTQEKSFDIQLKKGWNMLHDNLIEKMEVKDDIGMLNMEKKIAVNTIDKIPENINWYVKKF